MIDFQILNNPQLIHLENENGFIIATDIDITNIGNKIILFKGKYYNYDEGNLFGGSLAQIQYSMSEDVYFRLDSVGNIID